MKYENISCLRSFQDGHKKVVAFCGEHLISQYSSEFLLDGFPCRLVLDVYKTTSGKFVCVKSIQKIIYSELLPGSFVPRQETLYQLKSQETMWCIPEEKHKIVDFFGYSVPSKHIYESLEIDYEEEEFIE